jgi:superfamily I DNA and/or RNA helicase
LQANLFSIAIFDEASQIPLEHSFGALQRAKRFLVAGDPQQMSPSSYFSGSNDTLDLLHQSSFYLPNLFLSYHYRSYHTELISFSNTHFYQNRLHAFRHADFQENPIHFKYVEQAFYDNRVNIKEAQEVARFISQKINSKEKIGVVAFSENQLQAIFNELPQKIRDEIQDKMENDEIFFKSVENVQGDECDELIISFGYGFSEVEGVFAMRFGPMNLSNGAKRLNVLLTRARKMIHFFASVKSEDFKNSSNETVNLIRKWFQKIESQPEKSHNENFEVGFRKFVEENNNILVINTLISIYKNRKWKISNE